MRSAADGKGVSSAVDVYNSITGAWSTAQLSVARFLGLAAASVGNVALFAGGFESLKTSVFNNYNCEMMFFCADGCASLCVQ